MYATVGWHQKFQLKIPALKYTHAQVLLFYYVKSSNLLQPVSAGCELAVTLACTLSGVHCSVLRPCYMMRLHFCLTDRCFKLQYLEFL